MITMLGCTQYYLLKGISGNPKLSVDCRVSFFEAIQTQPLISPTALIEAFMAPGKIPGSSGTRNLHDNLSDLRAQVAANQKV